MPPSAHDLALERARSYLLRCRVEPSAELEAELERMVVDLPAEDDEIEVLARVMEHLWQRLERPAAEIPPAAPPIHRGTMGHG